MITSGLDFVIIQDSPAWTAQKNWSCNQLTHEKALSTHRRGKKSLNKPNQRTTQQQKTNDQMAQPQFAFNFDANAAAGEEGEELIIDMKQLKEQAIASLPEEVQPKIKELSTLQDKYDEIANKFHEELFQLQLKYEALYAPVLSERTKVIDQGVPTFWRNVLMQSELQDVVAERDMDALQYLTNISSKTFTAKDKEIAVEEEEEAPIGGFTLTFTFSENPYFSNTELTQTLYYDKSGEVIEGKADGCTINWKSQEKNLTVEKKTVKRGGKKKGAAQAVTSVVPCESFFNFFGSRTVEEEEDEDAEVQNIAGDDQLASILKEQIIPRAVDYYLGLISLDDEMMFDEDMLAGDYDEEEEEEEEAPPKKKGGKKAPAQFGGAAPASGDQQECKQQ